MIDQKKSRRRAYMLKFFMRWAYIIALLICTLSSPAAQAQSIDCTGTEQTIRVEMPISITVPRNLPDGAILTPWITTAPTLNYYRCIIEKNRVDHPASGMAFQPLSLVRSNHRATGDRGADYIVWNTNVPGVGVAIGLHVYRGNHGWSNWHSLGSNSQVLPLPWMGAVSTSKGSSIEIGGQIEVALVKIGPIAAGVVTGSVVAQGASATAPRISGPYTMGQTGRVSFFVSSTIINLAACNTPDVTVRMGSYKQSSFTGPGATTQTVAFNVGINACPAGINSIQYQFIPVNAVVDAVNGVLALSGDSTSAGIGLQLKDGNGKALTFNKQYTLVSYNSSTGGSYAIPLSANYYQTSPVVTPGSANALLVFAMTYQ